MASRSETYLATSLETDTTITDLDVFQMLRAAGQVEAALGLSEPSRYWGENSD